MQRTSSMSTDQSDPLLNDDDIRSSYAKLRALTKEEFSTGGGSADAYCLLTQISQQERGLTPEERERRADLALAEGLVDVFRNAADWIGQNAVASLTELWEKNGFASAVYDMLVNIISYRCCHSAKLGARVANEEHFFQADKLRLKSRIELKKLDQVAIVIQNMILLCDVAPAAIGRYRAHGVYTMVCEIYASCKYGAYDIRAS